MEKLKIMKIENNTYTLLNKDGEKFEFNLTFYDLEENLVQGDFIYFNKHLLNPNYKEYNKTYFFGPLDEVYGREIKSKEDIDLIKIKLGDKTIFLKRFFG